MAAIEAIIKGSLGAGQATGKPNAAPVTGFGLLFAVSSETPATTEGPASASGQALPTIEPPITEVDAMLGEGVDPLMQAQPDPEWSFASIAAEAETVNDLTVGLDEIAGVTMPSPPPGAEGEAVWVALGMIPSLPLDSEDAEKDVVLLDEVDDLDPTLVLAAPFAALLPDPALSHVNTETNSEDAPLQSLDFEPSLSLQNPESVPNGLDQVLASAGPNVNTQADTKAGALQSLVHDASAPLQWADGPSSSLIEESAALLDAESRGKAGPTSALSRAVSSSTLDPMTANALPVEPSPVSDGPQGHEGSLLSPNTPPVKTTVARMAINTTTASQAAPFAATEPVEVLEEPVKVRMTADTSQITAEKVDPFASGSKAQPAPGTSAPNLATILPENVSELPAPSAAGPMMAHALSRAVSSSTLDPMTANALPVEPSPVSDGPQGHEGSLLSPNTPPVKTTVARMAINTTTASQAAPFAATEPVEVLEEPVKVRMTADTSQITAEKVDPFASGSKAQPAPGTSAPNLATILPENVSELPAPSAAGPMMAQLRQTLDTRDAAWRERLVAQVVGEARDGAQSVKITLRPKSLGDIQLNIEISRSETTVRIITETASAARLLLANEDLLSHLMDQSGVRLTSMTAQAAAPTGWLGQANGQSTSQNSGGQSGRDGAGGRKDRARGAEAARAEPAATLKLGDSSQLSINLMA